MRKHSVFPVVNTVLAFLAPASMVYTLRDMLPSCVPNIPAASFFLGLFLGAFLSFSGIGCSSENSPCTGEKQ